jgi:CRP/FNR family transcriptional regulator, cyclic AMP receptor protein
MGQHERRDVTGNVSESSEVSLEVAAEPWQPRVHRGQPAALLDEVPVDERTTEAVDAGNDVWRGVDGPDPIQSVADMIGSVEQATQPGWSLEHDTVVALLDSVDWFSSLTHDELEALAGKAETVHWDLGDVVFEEGDRGDKCYIVHSGKVKVVRRFPDGRRITLARLGPGDVFGELALFNGERRSATIQASEPAVGIALGAETVMAILRSDPEAALSVAVSLADRLRATNERLFESSVSSVSGRVVATLLSQVEARQQQGAGDRDVEVVGSAIDIARLAGADRESATRVLLWLENEGIIALKRGKVLVRDVVALSKQLR